MVEIAGELNELMPVLTADMPEIIQDRDHVVSMVKSDGRDIYVVAVNYMREPTETKIEVADVRQGTAELVFGEPGTTNTVIDDGRLILGFKPLETRAYRIRRPDVTPLPISNEEED